MGIPSASSGSITPPLKTLRSSGGEMLRARTDFRATAACMAFGGNRWIASIDSFECASIEIPVSTHVGTASTAPWLRCIPKVGTPMPVLVGCLRIQPASSNVLAIDCVNLIDSSSAKTLSVYSVPWKRIKAAISSSLWTRDLGILSRFSSAWASAALCKASARSDSALAACVMADTISSANESASLLAPLERVSAFDADDVASCAEVTARTDAMAATAAEVFASSAYFVNRATICWLLSRSLVSTLDAWYVNPNSPATPTVTNSPPNNSQNFPEGKTAAGRCHSPKKLQTGSQYSKNSPTTTIAVEQSSRIPQKSSDLSNALEVLSSADRSIERFERRKRMCFLLSGSPYSFRFLFPLLS